MKCLVSLLQAVAIPILVDAVITSDHSTALSHSIFALYLICVGAALGYVAFEFGHHKYCTAENYVDSMDSVRDVMKNLNLKNNELITNRFKSIYLLPEIKGLNSDTIFHIGIKLLRLT